MAPELAYVTAKFAALAPFAKVADLLAELLPVGGAINAGTVRNRTRRVGEQIARLPPEGTADPDIDAVTPAVVIGLDGGYLRSRHRRPERNFEVIAGKVLNLDGTQHRFAFARNGYSMSEFANAVVSAGIRLGTPATVLCDGDPGLWKLQRRVMPDATLVLDWFHISMRFEHALQAARGLGAGTSSDCLRGHPICELEASKWKLWHGRSSACLLRLARLGIAAIYQRPNTSKPAPGHKIYPYLLRKLKVERPNHVWAMDITYIPMARGFVHRAAVVDWATRRVLSHRVSTTMEAEFCVEALKEALAKHGKPEISNTDQGSQFTSSDFTGVLLDAKIAISMDGKGCWRDNVFVERLWRSVKYEEVYLHAYDSVSEAKTSIARYLAFYNTRRRHTSLDARTPDEAYFSTKQTAMAA